MKVAIITALATVVPFGFVLLALVVAWHGVRSWRAGRGFWSGLPKLADLTSRSSTSQPAPATA